LVPACCPPAQPEIEDRSRIWQPNNIPRALVPAYGLNDNNQWMLLHWADYVAHTSSNVFKGGTAMTS